ncbi:cysteine proteinase inhibitor 5-like [Argentina anserina]|uniref:cysteine proteinase inhibitor 5-like n=1 Tax=Argentina anserina TaxID=57926 RepID=UPI0021766A0A|nr:cysteine proteinase inhibitor 5-like [Potentilla anserina]
MRRHRLVLALFALLLLLLPLVTAVADETVIGGWTPIKNIGDPHVKEIAEFAVSEYNQSQKKSLVFQSVVRGETQVVAGIKYRLVISVNEGDSLANYEAVVWEKIWIKFRKLISFNKAGN